MLGNQNNAQNGPSEFHMPSSSPSDLEECPSCGRKFNEKAYEKHVKVCQEVFVKKRKEFNSKSKRIVCDE